MVIRKSRRKWGEKLHIQKDEKQTMLLENELEKHYRGLADELTGLPNRTYFERRLKSQWLRAKEEQLSFAVMILSIDGLKYINDILGYQLGEQLIIEIARELKTVLGKENFICRFSGNQFAAIIEGINLDKYENIAQNIIRLFSSPFKVDRYELDVSINIGLSVCLPDEQDSDALIDKAYIALLLAKKEGKNTYNLSSPDINIKYDKEFGLRHDLCKAIEKEQFKVYYQPLVNLKTNEILAAEALVRWEHPHWGMISPNEFIYLAEETGFIISMGDWILREVCQNYKHWLDNGLPSIKVSINFSSIQFFADDFVKNIVNTIKDFKLDPHFLIVEITESTLMIKIDKAIPIVQRLQSLGIQVALDNFGTGFTSLSYLNNFHIDILKIDASFIENITLNETSKVITKYIINITHELKIKPVAEGIENGDQLSFLREFNCDTGQGYIYSKPVAEKDFKRILAKKKCDPNTATEVRRKFFRVVFHQLLLSEMTISAVKGKSINVGNTKVLIKNIGPGGLCFISNIKLPVGKDFTLQFTTQLAGEMLQVFGYCVWMEMREDNLYEYGVELILDENDRSHLVRKLNKVQISIRNNILYTTGSSFFPGSPRLFFRQGFDRQQLGAGYSFNGTTVKHW